MLQAKRAFQLQLWMGRSLFIASLGLLVGFATYSTIAGDFDVVSATMAAGSLASFIVAAVTDSSDKIGNALADVTQLELVLMTTVERIGVASEFGYAAVEKSPDLAEARSAVESIMAHLKAVADDAVRQIQDFAEPRGFRPPTGPDLAGGEGEAPTGS